MFDMRRDYNNFEFCHVVDFLTSRVPGITIATDVICGFPTESEEDFEETMKLVEKYKFSVLHISQFYPRPGTPAARLPRLATEIVKARSRRLTALFERQMPYDGFVGQTQRILITEISTDKKHYVGHNSFYHQVLVPLDSDEELMGKMVEVEIERCGKHYMMARVINDDPIDRSSLWIKNLDSGNQSVDLEVEEEEEAEEEEDDDDDEEEEDKVKIDENDELEIKGQKAESISPNFALIFVFQFIQTFIIINFSFPSFPLMTIIIISAITALLATFAIKTFLSK